MTRCYHQWIETGPSPALPICTLCLQSPSASPSQVETWRDCPRKHAYSRIRDRPPNAAAAFGERAHAQAENWLRDGAPPDNLTIEGRSIMTGLALLPPPKAPGLIIEHRATPILHGIQWDMRLDYLWAPGPSVIIVGDHKTTGDIAKNAKTSETLSTTDPQGIAYMHWALETFDAPVGRGQWTYYQRDAKARARAVVFELERKDAAERFEQMHHSEVLPMVRSRALTPEELPRNLQSCSKYGGCPYSAECLATVSPAELAAVALNKLRDPLQALLSAEPPTPQETTMLPADLRAALIANQGKVPEPVATPVAQIQTTVFPPNPGGAPPAPTDPAAALELYLATLPADQAAQVRAAMVPAQPMPITAPAEVVVPEIPQNTATPPVVEVAPPKPKRGRPKKSDGVVVIAEGFGDHDDETAKAIAAGISNVQAKRDDAAAESNDPIDYVTDGFEKLEHISYSECEDEIEAVKSLLLGRIRAMIPDADVHQLQTLAHTLESIRGY